MALPLLRSGKVALPKGATHLRITKTGASGVRVDFVKAKKKAARKARRKK